MMSNPKRPPQISFVWPLELLERNIRELNQQNAIIILVDDVKSFNKNYMLSDLAKRLIQHQTKLFAITGKESEQSHDDLDCLLEKMNVEDVLTSWHEDCDAEDVANFVAVNSQSLSLTQIIVVVDESTEFGIELKKEIEDAIE